MTASNKLLSARGYKEDISWIIDVHFKDAEARVDEIYGRYFSDVKEVLGRHWRNKRDIPYELINPIKYLYNILRKRLFKKSSVNAFPRSGKAREIEAIISEHLLDLPGLEKKISKYVDPYEERFRQEMSEILAGVPALRRKDFTDDLRLRIDRLQTPIDGAKEATLWLVAGIVGKVYSDSLGGTITAGIGVGKTIYLSQLSWFGSLWVHFFGAPVWVSWVGGIGGLLAMIIVAPTLTPFIEIGINKFRARKILKASIRGARERLNGSDNDAFDLAGKTAMYLQFLPDVIDAARKAYGLFR